MPDQKPLVDRMRGTGTFAARVAPKTEAIVNGKSQRLSRLLKEARTRSGLTQEQLAGLSTVSIRAIRDLEVGRVQRPRNETLRLLADAMRLSGPRRAALEMAAGRQPVVDTPQDVANNTQSAAPPMPTGPFVGRGPQLRAVTELLGNDGERLVSIVGGIGMGKTRLALEAAQVLHRRDQTPIVWVPMGGSVNALEGRPQPMLANWVRDLLNDWGSLAEFTQVIDRTTLLVLDGLEVTDTVKSVIGQLLDSNLWLRVLITTRDPEPRLGGRLLALAPLALPADSTSVALAEQPAVSLMMSYLRHLRPEVLPTEAVVTTMASVCQALDGVPLALESAASWLSVYAPHQLLEEAQRSPVTLTEPVSDPGAAFGFRRVLERSIARLSPQHGALLYALAGFEGSWTVDTVAHHTGGNPAWVGRGVHALLVRGLICPVGAGESQADGVSRFSVLNLVKHLLAVERRASLPVAVSPTESVERLATPICAT
ncbi:helix-turn-helix domain-containing protein [Streptomyces viridochromogenes]|uniref:helix-turn-helix domain-containing protein n=1 Tax=Streptomyces viridochromogenes TaxID=1938 RepID=UPI0031D6DAD8